MRSAKGSEAEIRILACGDTAMTVEFSSKIDDSINRQVIEFANEVRRDAVVGLVDVVATYRSFTVIYQPDILPGAILRSYLRKLPNRKSQQSDPVRQFTIPVFYGCIENDLAELATEKGMRPDEIVNLHLSARYRVYMIGFAPGFAYLGGLPERLYTPRRAMPRQRIDAGAIGIGGKQASISSVAGPSGWHFVGKTPVRLFQPLRTDPFLLRAGDNIRFRSIEKPEYDYLQDRVSFGKFCISELMS